MTKTSRSDVAAPVAPAWRDDYLRQHYANTATDLVAQALQLTPTQTRARAAQLGIKKLPKHRTVRASPLTDEQKALLRRHYATKTNAELMELIPVARTVIASLGNRMGLTKTPEARQRAWDEGGRNSNRHAGHYKPGCIGNRNVPVGTERWTKPASDNPNGPRYLVRKLPAPHGWQVMHRWIWMQHHGPIPPKHVITFRDGNSANLHIDNLRCAAIGDMVVERNGKVPPELVTAYRLRIELEKVIRKKDKKP